MIDLIAAKNIVIENIPTCKIKKCVIYHNKYVFYAPTDDEIEGDMNPYYYVNINTGEFGGFPMLLPQNIECMDLFVPR